MRIEAEGVNKATVYCGVDSIMAIVPHETMSMKDMIKTTIYNYCTLHIYPSLSATPKLTNPFLAMHDDFQKLKSHQTWFFRRSRAKGLVKLQPYSTITCKGQLMAGRLGKVSTAQPTWVRHGATAKSPSGRCMLKCEKVTCSS